MRTDLSSFIETTDLLSRAGSGPCGSCPKDVYGWFLEAGLPQPVLDLFRDHAPLGDVWAGAGGLFPAATVVAYNKLYPEALAHDLLIIGSAPNGDHITIDLNDGSTGYLSHEHDWRCSPRKFFIP